MSSNIISVVGLKGDSAEWLTNTLNRILKNKSGDYSSTSSDDWNNQDQLEIKNVIANIEKTKHVPPSFYSIEYVDSWSVAGSSMGSYKLPGIRKYINTEMHNVAFYTDDDIPLMPVLYNKLKRRSFYKNQREDRWYIDSINECVKAVNWLEGPTCIVAYTKFLSGSVTDDIYKESLKNNVIRQ